MNRMEKEISLFSQFYHLIAYQLALRTLPLRTGMLITSIDIDVGSHILGEINGGKNDRNVHTCLSERTVGALEETCVPLLASLFEELHIPVTFALRGQLLDVDTSIARRLLDSPVKFDIGAHGYYHRAFPTLSRNEAEMELSMIRRSMRNLGIKPTSFVFPKNQVWHLDLLEEFGYRAYRGLGGLFRDSTRINRVSAMYDVHPSLFVTKGANVQLLMKLLDVIIARKLILHIWFHPKDLGTDGRAMEISMQRVYRPFFEYARRNHLRNLLQFETMSSVVDTIQKST